MDGVSTRVVHCRLEPFDVYVGRPSLFGNPFSHKSDTLAKYRVKTPEEAVEKYREWVIGIPPITSMIPGLKGKVLGCWCKTKRNPDAPCHGDVLAVMADNA